MEQAKEYVVDDRAESKLFRGNSSSAVDMAGNPHSSEGSEQSDLQKADLGKTPKSAYPRRNPTNRQVNTHRRFKSYPTYSTVPLAPIGWSPPAHSPFPQAGNNRASQPGQEKNDGQYHQQVPLYHPWVSGYDMQWSAYGMYVLSTVMSKRSEKPTRIIFIGNLAPTVEEKQVIDAASKYGPVRGVDVSLREYWFGMFVSYWDIRHAEEAVRSLPEQLPGVGSDDVQQIPVTVCFMLPPTVPGMENQGQLNVNIVEGVTTTDIRKLFMQFGEVKSVRSLTEDSKSVEFYDARDAEAAIRQVKLSKYNHIVKDVEYLKLITAPEQTIPTTVAATIPTTATTTVAATVPTTAAATIYTGKNEDSGNSENEVSPHSVTTPWAGTPPSYASPWGQYSMPPPPPLGLPQNYAGERSLQRQNSAPAGSYQDPHHGVYPVRRPDAVWNGHYIGYPPHSMQPWPYTNSPHQPQPVPMMPVSGRFDGVGNHLHRMDSHPGSPGYESHSNDNHSWRPHRTRSAGERVYDPAQFQFNLAEANNDPAAARTTLMIRNIPNKYSQKMLLDVLNKRYSGRFDFFYLPIDFKNRCNLGYAFVNFVDAATTVEFYKEFHTKSWEEFNSKKVCEITYARVQGRDCLIEHFRNSRFPCNDPDYLPLVFEIEPEGKKPGSKGTPVHHSASTDYTETTHSAVAAH